MTDARPFYNRQEARTPGKPLGATYYTHDRRWLDKDGSVSEPGDPFDPAKHLHPAPALPAPMDSICEAVTVVSEAVGPLVGTLAFFELDADGKPGTLVSHNTWTFDPTETRDVFGALKEPVKVVQTVVNQNYAPPMRG